MNKIFTKSSYNSVERGIRTKKSEINSLMENNSLFQEKSTVLSILEEAQSNQLATN